MAIRRFGNALAACFFVLTGCHSAEWEGEPKLFAHRGASDRFNESTLTAYEVAAREGVDALEMDLRMTADGELVIMHDETIDRTTSGSGFVVQYTFAEIAAYPTVGMSGREAVPRLRDVLEKFGTSEHYYIETRLVNGEAKMEAPLIELLAEYGLMEQKRVSIQSFSAQSLRRVHELAPEIPLTRLFDRGKVNLIEAASPMYDRIGIESTDATRGGRAGNPSAWKRSACFFQRSPHRKRRTKASRKTGCRWLFYEPHSVYKSVASSERAGGPPIARLFFLLLKSR